MSVILRKIGHFFRLIPLIVLGLFKVAENSTVANVRNIASAQLCLLVDTCIPRTLTATIPSQVDEQIV